MTTLHPTDDRLFDLVLSRDKDGIMVSIDHAYTIVRPEDLVRKAEELATDIKLERMTQCTEIQRHTG